MTDGMTGVPSPLNANGWPAASLTPVTGLDASGAASGDGAEPFFGMLMRWKPAICHDTLSPTWIRTAFGKNELMSASFGTPAGAFLRGGPAMTVFVAAEAMPGTARLQSAAAMAT